VGVLRRELGANRYEKHFLQGYDKTFVTELIILVWKQFYLSEISN